MVINPSGKRIATYRKMHLFQLNSGKKNIDESSLFEPGDTPATFTLNGWQIGLTICYDLRFPELFRTYVGSDLLVCTSEFTAFTGKAHWEVLLKARAIENQCFVAGVNQCGRNETINIEAYGHSMLVDPWGTPVIHTNNVEDVLQCQLNKKRISYVRNKIPALNSISPTLRNGNSRNHE